METKESKEIMKTEFEKFMEKTRENQSPTVQMLVKILDGLDDRYYHFGREMESVYNQIKKQEKNETEQDIIEHKLQELESSKSMMTAEDQIIYELLKEKLNKINKSLEKKEDEPEFKKIKLPADYKKYFDWFDWFDWDRLHSPQFYRIVATNNTKDM